MIDFDTATTNGLDPAMYCRFILKNDVGDPLGYCGVYPTHVLMFENIPERVPQGACHTHGLRVTQWWRGLSMIPIKVWLEEHNGPHTQ